MDETTRTFLELPPERCNPLTAKYQIVPVPYHGTVCFLSGTAEGPAAILEVSDQMEHFDEELLTDWTASGIFTQAPIYAAATPELEFERIYETVKERKIFLEKKNPIFLGGEHSITPPIVRAASERFNNISVLQFDAHADLRESYTGGKYSHASAMRRVLDWTPHLVQIGIRSFSQEEYLAYSGRIAKIITPQQVRNNFESVIEKVLDTLTDNVYITVDIDVFDPAFAPGTGTPEPNGLDWQQVCGIIRQVCEMKNVVGADVVEVAPLGKNNVVTEFLAARLVGKMIAYQENKKR
ncbi:agmatinase [Planctomycetales bacterium]|nr:agmatinase [Planctomycetales bacterium]